MTGTSGKKSCLCETVRVAHRGCIRVRSVYWNMGDVYGWEVYTGAWGMYMGGKLYWSMGDGYRSGGNEAEELGKCQSEASLFIYHAEKFGLWRLHQ